MHVLGRPCTSFICAALGLVAGCEREGDVTDAGEMAGEGLPVRHPFDPAAAARGERLLTEGGGLARSIALPRLAIENLWWVWNAPPTTGDTYWQAFRDRYGFIAPPFDNDGLPLGIRDIGGGEVSFDCLACHAGEVRGQTIIGLANTRVDLQSLFDDLYDLAENPPPGYPSFDPARTIQGLTGARGVSDAMGLGLSLAMRPDPTAPPLPMLGFQDPPAWFAMKHKDRIYADGSGEVGQFKTMQAMMLAFGLGPAELADLDDEFADIHAYLLSLPTPAWPLSIDQEAAARGREVFGSTCAACHGEYGPGGFYPDHVEDVGTDPVRDDGLSPEIAAWITARGFGPMQATDGYLAPPLVGVWATAPYLHNGSIPSLHALLDSSLRPSAWSSNRTYDPQTVGLSFATEVATGASPGDVDARRVYDTLRPGMSNTGHLWGDSLTIGARTDLLEYLKTL